MADMNLKQFLHAGGGNLLKKALDSGSTSGGALIHEFLEEVITDQIIAQYPEWSLIRPKHIGSDSYKHKARTTRGSTGGAVGENALLATNNATYSQPDIPLKIVARQFSVTDFLRDSTSENLDAFAQELENTVADQTLSLNAYNIHGNAVADPFQYTGWDKSIITNRNGRYDGFSSGLATVPASLKVFNNMINASNRKGGNRYQRAFIMSADMSSLLSELYTAVRKNIEAQTIRLPGGHELESYRGIPILESTCISGAHSGTMTPVLAASGGVTGGNLPNGTYYFRVTAITPEEGEIMASAETFVTLAGGGVVQQINLTFTAYPNAIAYKVYYSATTGLTGQTLIRWSAANTYDGDGTITGNVALINLTDVIANSTVAGLEADQPPTAVSGVNCESMHLICLDEFQGMGRFAHNNAGQRENGIINYEELGKLKMSKESFLATHGAIVPAFEGNSVKANGWRPE